MSLDGFIAGLDDHAGQELGRDGGRLHDWGDDRMSEWTSPSTFRLSSTHNWRLTCDT
jgi:hypothetical protein